MRKLSLVPLLLIGGCMGSSGVRPLRPLEIATAPYRGVVSSSLPGSLMYEGDCLLFRTDAGGAILLPVWPWGSSFNGTAVLFHEPARADQRIIIAQQILLSGEAADWASLDGIRYAPLQRQCGAYQPFFVASVRPAD